MFVTNCEVDRSEVLRYPLQGNNNHKKAKKKKNSEEGRSGSGDGAAGSSSESMGVDSAYHPVKCSQCSTEVGVFDSDEVFHFFNVIESNG